MKFDYQHRNNHDIRICLTAETLTEATLINLLGHTIKKPVGVFGGLYNPGLVFIWIVIPMGRETPQAYHLGNGYHDFTKKGNEFHK